MTKATGQFWTAEQTADPAAKDAGGWALIYDPTPGGRDNGDGTRTYSMRFPALALTGWVSEPEKAAKAIADMLNRAEPATPPADPAAKG